MITATPAPAVQNKQLLFIPYAYALVLVVLIITQLLTLSSFIALIGSFVEHNPATNASTLIAMLLIGMEVFSLPFLLQLHVSPLARFCSAVLAFITPLAWAVVAMMSNSFTISYLILVIGFFLLGSLSFWALGGPSITRLNKKIT